MSVTRTGSFRRQHDHFEPQDTDPHEQRRLRGLLEQIDYAAFVANREVIGQMLPALDSGTFQRLAVLTATAIGLGWATANERLDKALGLALTVAFGVSAEASFWAGGAVLGLSFFTKRGGWVRRLFAGKPAEGAQ
jgi:hypothetical protein